MISCTVTLLLLLAGLSSAKTSQSHGPTTGDSRLQAPDHRKAESRSSNAGFDVRFFAPLDGSTLPPVVTSADWQYSNDQQKGEKLRASSRWTNEIVRRRSFAGGKRDGKSDETQPETSANKLTGSATNREHGVAENNKSFEVRRSSKGSSSVGEKVMLSQRDHDGYNTTQNHATAEVTSNFGTADESDDEVEASYHDDDDADYGAAAEAADYDVDEEYDDEEEKDDLHVVDHQEDEEPEEKRAKDKTSVGREYIEYEISADSSRPVDYDDTNTEVVNELQVVNQPAGRRRKGRPRTVKKTRKRRRKRPPVEPVGRVKIPKRKRRPTSNAGTRRRKPKARRRRKGQNNKGRKRRKNRRNKQTASLSFDFGGNNRKVDNAEVGQSTKPRLQQSASELIQRLQQQYQHQQHQQQSEYDGQYYASRYPAGYDRRRIFAAPTNFHGQSSHEAATNRGVHASVIGRVPPVHSAEQTSPRPQPTDLQGRYVDPRHYQRPRQHQHRTYYNHQPHSQQQQPQHHQRPLYPRQFYHYQQQSAPTPTYSRHQQQIHFIVPTNDFDLRRIPEVMSALGLQHYVSGPIAVGEAQLQFLGDQSPSSNSGGTYREGHPASRPVDEDVDQLGQLSSLSGIGPASSGEAVKHVRHERSTNGRRRALTTSDSDDEEAHHSSDRVDTTRDRSENSSEDYVDNSDIEITTRSPTHQTTAL